MPCTIADKVLETNSPQITTDHSFVYSHTQRREEQDNTSSKVKHESINTLVFSARESNQRVSFNVKDEKSRSMYTRINKKLDVKE